MTTDKVGRTIYGAKRGHGEREEVIVSHFTDGNFNKRMPFHLLFVPGNGWAEGVSLSAAGMRQLRDTIDKALASLPKEADPK